MSSVLAHLTAPVDIGRDQARDLAERELLDPVYANAEPPWWQKVASWAMEKVGDLLDRVGDATGNLLWLIVLGAVGALVTFVVIRRIGGVQRTGVGAREVFSDALLTANDHRSLAQAAAGREDWSGAVRESFRAIVRQLEERGALDIRPGRTADEAAHDAGVRFAELRVDLERAARTFDEVVYGARPATADEYRTLLDLDRRLISTTQVAH